MKGLFLLLAGMALAGSAQEAGRSPAALSPSRFGELQRLIKPTPEESLWSSVPWLGDLNEARRRAAAEGKPLFVWTMAGEPLGMC